MIYPPSEYPRRVRISHRRDIESTTKFAPPDRVHFQFGDEVLSPWALVKPDEAVARIHEVKPGATVLHLIHGFHADMESVMDGYDDIYGRVCVPPRSGSGDFVLRPYDIVVEHYWPGSWSGTVGYGLAMARVPETVSRILRAVMHFYMNGCVNDVMGHSMGCRIAIQMADLGEHRLRVVDLLAPAVRNDALSKSSYLPYIRTWFSRNDPVLAKTYRLWPENWLGPNALGYSGPVPSPFIDQATDCSEFVHSHGGYRKSIEFWAQWHRQVMPPYTPRLDAIGGRGEVA